MYLSIFHATVKISKLLMILHCWKVRAALHDTRVHKCMCQVHF